VAPERRTHRAGPGVRAMVCSALVSGLLATPLLAQSAASSPQAELQPLLDDQIQAANAHDTERFLTTYLHDSTLVFVFNGGVVQGYDALHAIQLKAWSSSPDVVYTLRGPTTYRVLSPTIALATMLLGSRRTAPSGEVKTNELTVTMVWQKRPEGWRIVEGHESSVH